MIDYRKMMHLYERGVSKNCLAVSFKCKWETVDRAVERIASKWGSSENIPEELTNEGIRLEILSLGKMPDASYYVPEFSKLSNRDLGKQRQVLWEKYCEEAAEKGLKPYQISHFNDLLSEYLARCDVSYAQDHLPGLECQVDWCGDRGHYLDTENGRLVDVHVIVIVMPYSSYAYAEGFLDETMKSFLAGHRHAFEHFGGVPPYVVPDNCATVTDRKTGMLNTAYTRFLDHYGALPRPTRVRAPKDKGCTERHVGIIERSIIPALDEMPLNSLEEFNRMLQAKVDRLNAKPFAKRNGCRKSVFEEEEKGRLKPLPLRTYLNITEKKATVSRDYHIQYDKAFYSVPVGLIGEKVTVRDDGFEVVVYDGKGKEVARHPKATHRWQRRTDEKHIPVGHSYDNAYSLDHFLEWALRFGPNMRMLCKRISESFTFPVQSFRTLNSILASASRSSSPAHAEAAAEKCLAAGVSSAKGFRSMLGATISAAGDRQDPSCSDLNEIFCAHEEEVE